MGADLVELHDRCGQHFTELVAGVRSDQWHDSTPCSEWDVRALVHHLLYEDVWVAPLMEGKTIADIGDQYEGDLMGDDASTWSPLVARAQQEAHAAIAQPGALGRTVHLSYADVPGEEYVRQLTADLLIHGWDLARATGQDESLDLDTVAVILPWAEANAELFAGSGMFAPSLTTDESDGPDVRLLALLGRQA
jgi:uncharacterized protein (TIGR03086 family)